MLLFLIRFLFSPVSNRSIIHDCQAQPRAIGFRRRSRSCRIFAVRTPDSRIWPIHGEENPPFEVKHFFLIIHAILFVYTFLLHFSKLPYWIQSFVPKIFYITEKAWNYYPFTITGEKNLHSLKSFFFCFSFSFYRKFICTIFEFLITNDNSILFFIFSAWGNGDPLQCIR